MKSKRYPETTRKYLETLRGRASALSAFWPMFTLTLGRLHSYAHRALASLFVLFLPDLDGEGHWRTLSEPELTYIYTTLFKMSVISSVGRVLSVSILRVCKLWTAQGAASPSAAQRHLSVGPFDRRRPTA